MTIIVIILIFVAIAFHKWVVNDLVRQYEERIKDVTNDSTRFINKYKKSQYQIYELNKEIAKLKKQLKKGQK